MNEFGILHLQDERFNTAESREMQLLIRVAPKRISYAIVHQKENRLSALYDAPVHHTIEEALNEVLRANEYLRSPFATIKVSIETLNFTLIPTQYYTKGDMASYEQLVQAHEGTKTFVSAVNADALRCITALDMEVTAPFISVFSELKLFSQVNSLLEGGLKMPVQHASKLLLQFNTDSFEAYYSTGGKHAFYNMFKIENADDFNYFLLLLMQQLNIDGQKTSVLLAGDIVQGDVYESRVEKYFNDTSFADSSKIVSFPDEFNQIQGHKFFSLISLRECE